MGFLIRRLTSPSRTLAVAFAVAAIFMTRDATTSLAHASLVRAEPAVNSQLREAPKTLTLYFSEPLEKRFSSVRVVDQTGGRVDERVEFDGADNSIMRVALKDGSPGFLTVAWENVSTIDGHRITGSYPLTILNTDGSAPAGAASSVEATVSGTAPKPQRVAVKALLLTSGALLSGAFAFLVFVSYGAAGSASNRATTSAGAALVVLLIIGAAELLNQSTDLGVSVGSALETQWGERWFWRNLALLVPLAALTVLLSAKSADQRAIAGIGLLGTMAYLALTSSVSHAAAGAGAFWATASDFIHLVAASVWIGMLSQIALLFFSANKLGRSERLVLLRTSLGRFSNVALVSVALLLFTGTVNAVIEVGRISELLGSTYGLILAAKLLVLLPLLGIGALNAFVLRPGLQDAVHATRRPTDAGLLGLETSLRNLVRYEVAIALGVLAITGLLAQTSPARGTLEREEIRGKFEATQKAGDLDVTLLVDPNEPGQNTFEVYFSGAVNSIEAARIEFARVGDSEAGARLALEAIAPPTDYLGRGPFLGQPGNWNLTVVVRRMVGSDSNVSFELRVPRPLGARSSTGDFGNPLSLDIPLAVILAAMAVLCAGLIVGGLPRSGLPSGYLGKIVARQYERLPRGRIESTGPLAALIVVGVALGLLFGSRLNLSRQSATGNNPVEPSPQSIERGQMLFLRNCSQCHGDTGLGNGPMATSLTRMPANLYDHLPYHPDQFFFEIMTNGLGDSMPPQKGSISEKDRWHILNYLRATFGQQTGSQ